MTRFLVEIELGNDGMQSLADVDRALRGVLVTEVVSLFDPLVPGASGRVVDPNGNTVGSWRVEEETLS